MESVHDDVGEKLCSNSLEQPQTTNKILCFLYVFMSCSGLALSTVQPLETLQKQQSSQKTVQSNELTHVHVQETSLT